MDKKIRPFSHITKSKFVRSLFLQVLAILLLVSIAIIAIVFFSFSSEINKSVIEDKQKQLAVIEDTISTRMEEISSIAYSISEDPTFFLEPVDDSQVSSYEMSNTLSRYLIGNGFIEHLAYYRFSEPDIIYTSSGELSLSDFLCTYLKLDHTQMKEHIKKIRSITTVEVVALDFASADKSYFSYTCPLPQFSAEPQAMVLMLIPVSEVKPLLESQLRDSVGEVAVFDAGGREIYNISTLEEDRAINLADYLSDAQMQYITVDGSKYVLQNQVSDSNGWTFVSLLRLNDIISGLASRQILFIVLLLVLMLAAVFAMLICISVQFKPINRLAMEVTGENAGSEKHEVVDEKVLLSSTFATLKDDSEQKQKYETAYYEAEAANKAKSAFLSSMSHDIRTPMNAIIGMTAIARKHTDDPAYVDECLQKVQVASEYLLDIINNVLDMSRIESGRFTLTEEVIELPRFMYGLMTILNQSVTAKKQHLLVEVENIYNEKVLGDNVRLMQVFMNILSNAVKFTPEGGTISLQLRQTEAAAEAETVQDCGTYIFSFTDTGIGMAPEFVERVFDTFSRAKDANVTKVEGTGLGMAIAKNLVELMGGAIKCTSVLGQGTTFTVTLPMKSADAGTRAETAAYAAKYQNWPVLIVSAEERTGSNQVEVFAQAGIAAHYAPTAVQAAAMLRQAQMANTAYKMLLLNQEDDDKDGIRAITAIAAAADLQNTECVLVVKELSSINQEPARKAGMTAFVQIPLFVSTVFNIMDGNFAAPAADHKKQVTIPDLEGRRVLMAEDNNLNREIARKLIGETKAAITEAVNGQEAACAFREHPAGYFDLILMDLQMPVMNGYEATAAIRSLPREDALTIPIYALTASTFDEDVRQVKETGMNGHIGKPYAPEELYRVLAQVLG